LFPGKALRDVAASRCHVHGNIEPLTSDQKEEAAMDDVINHSLVPIITLSAPMDLRMATTNINNNNNVISKRKKRRGNDDERRPHQHEGKRR
jgi:hypothetical protein